MSGYYLRAYGVALDGSTSGSLKIRLKLRQADSDDFATSSHWTPATGDVKVSKDFGSEANIATLPSYVNGWWEFALSATELTAKQVGVSIVDDAVVSEAFIIETFGDSDADYADDFTEDGASQASLDELAGDVEAIDTAVDALAGTELSVVSPVGTDGDVEVYRARDYADADGLALEWTNSAGTWPDLTGATIVVRLGMPGCSTVALHEFDATAPTPSGASQTVRLELTDADLSIRPDDYRYDVVATLASGRIVNLYVGSWSVLFALEAPPS